MAILKRVFNLVTFILYFIQLLMASPISQTVTHLQNNKSSEHQFLIRKCCGPGQVYNFNWEEDVADRKDRCVDHQMMTNYSSQNDSRPLIFVGSHELPFQHSIENKREIDVGFPRNCTPDLYGSTLILLEPDTRMADLFYPIESGQLLVPHRFWIFQTDDHCIEDFVLNGNFQQARRVAFICTSHAHPFPTGAIDDFGKLRIMNFIQRTALVVNLSAMMSGRRVVRKCCDRNEVYSQYRICVESRGASTLFFDGLDDQLSKIDNELFFRFGSPVCAHPFNYKRQTINFELKSNGSLEIISSAGGGLILSPSHHHLVSIEHYCIEDIVYKDSDGLPITSNVAIYCSDKEEELQSPNNNESIAPSADDTDDDDEVIVGLVQMNTPKCCPSGYVMMDGYVMLEDNNNITCQSLITLDGESSDYSQLIISLALNNYMRKSYNISSVLMDNSSISCQLMKSIPFKKENYDGAVGKVLLESDSAAGNNNVLLLSSATHFYTENYWDFKVNHRPFCVDLALVRNEKKVYYEPQVFYCTSKYHVSIHYPILLLVSVVGLLATFLIYFFVPASGSAKLVTSGFGSSNRKRSAVQTMAMMLTGRILLCHIITLSLTFISLAIVQLELVRQGQAECIAMGYITYFASIASFSWLAVYCFDYYRIFSGSFKVSNEMLFIPYSAFGWGFPILAVVAAAVAQFQSTQLGISEILNPNMGLLKCWFADGSSAMIFFYAPVGCLLLFDVVCFLTLLFNPNLMNCWKRKKELTIRANNRNTSKDSKENQDFKMALKLFFITGIPWIFEFAAWLPFYLSDNSSSFLRINSIYFFEISNLFNSLRGVIIFIIFVVSNRDVRRFLWPRIKMIFIKGDDSNIARKKKSNIEDPSSSNHSTSGITNSTNSN